MPHVANLDKEKYDHTQAMGPSEIKPSSFSAKLNKSGPNDHFYENILAIVFQSC